MSACSSALLAIFIGMTAFGLVAFGLVREFGPGDRLISLVVETGRPRVGFFFDATSSDVTGSATLALFLPLPAIIDNLIAAGRL